MNERIRKLAKQAGAQGIVNRDFIDIEKFAELIVRECALTCEQVGWEEDSPYGAIAWDCAAAVREQFGVEE